MRLFQFLLLCFSLSVWGQDATSIKKINYALENAITSQPDSVLRVIKNLQRKSNNNQVQKSQLLIYEAMIYCQYKAKFDVANKLNSQSYLINKRIKNKYGLAYNYYNFAQIFHRKSDYVNAVNYYHRAMNDVIATKNFVLHHKILIGLSGVYLDQKDYSKSLQYAQESADLYIKSKDLYYYATAVGFKAETYRLMGDYEKAEKLFQKAYDTHKKINKIDGMAWVLSNWSLVYETDLIKSVEMELEAEKLWNKIAPEGYLAVNNLGNIGWCFDAIAHNDSLVKIKSKVIGINTKEAYLNRSELYYQKAIAISKKTKTPNIYLYFSKSLADLQARRNNFSAAYNNLLVYNKLNDSLYSQENKNKISEFENAKKIALKDKQIEINQLIIKKNENQKWFLIILSILLSCIGLLLYFLYKNKNASNLKLALLNKELEESNRIKNRFFNILNHDLKGPLAHIVQFFNFKKEKILEGENLELMETKIAAKTENLLASMEDLLFWGKSQMATFTVNKEKVSIKSIFHYLEKHFSYVENFDLSFEDKESIIIFTDEDILKTICRNLTSNAINALQDKAEKKITWKAHHFNNEVHLTITDSGGSNEEIFENLFQDNAIGIKHGLGLHLIRELSKSIHLTIDLKTTDTETEITLIFNDK